MLRMASSAASKAKKNAVVPPKKPRTPPEYHRSVAFLYRMSPERRRDLQAMAAAAGAPTIVSYLDYLIFNDPLHAQEALPMTA